jgi:hypothetical protein
MRKLILVALLLALLPSYALANGPVKESLGIHKAVVVWDYALPCPWHSLREEVVDLYSTLNYEDDAVKMEVLGVSAERTAQGWKLINIGLLITFKSDMPETEYDVLEYVYNFIIENGYDGVFTYSNVWERTYTRVTPREEGGS